MKRCCLEVASIFDELRRSVLTTLGADKSETVKLRAVCKEVSKRLSYQGRGFRASRSPIASFFHAPLCISFSHGDNLKSHFVSVW